MNECVNCITSPHSTHSPLTVSLNSVAIFVKSLSLFSFLLLKHLFIFGKAVSSVVLSQVSTGSQVLGDREQRIGRVTQTE